MLFSINPQSPTNQPSSFCVQLGLTGDFDVCVDSDQIEITTTTEHDARRLTDLIADNLVIGFQSVLFVYVESKAPTNGETARFVFRPAFVTLLDGEQMSTAQFWFRSAAK